MDDDDATRTEDPFDIVKRDVQHAFQDLTKQMEKWRVMLQEVNTSEDTDFSSLHKKIESHIKTLEWDLQPLEEAIGMMVENPQKYSISSNQLEQRKEFVHSLKSKVLSYRNELQSPTTKAKMEQDQRELLFKQSVEEFDYDDEEENIGNPSSSSKRALLAKAKKSDNEKFIQQHNAKRILRDQDNFLGQVSSTVQNLKNIAGSISSQLKSQDELIDRASQHVDTTSGRLSTAQRRTNSLLKKMKNDRSCCAIVLLSILAVILFFLYILV